MGLIATSKLSDIHQSINQAGSRRSSVVAQRPTPLRSDAKISKRLAARVSQQSHEINFILTKLFNMYVYCILLEV
jgi:hypothetical protein